MSELPKMCDLVAEAHEENSRRPIAFVFGVLRCDHDHTLTDCPGQPHTWQLKQLTFGQNEVINPPSTFYNDCGTAMVRTAYESVGTMRDAAAMQPVDRGS